MKIVVRSLTVVPALALAISASAVAVAAPRVLTVTGNVSYVEGSYGDTFVAGQPFSGSFVYDPDERNVDPDPITEPSDVPGHEYTSLYECSTAPCAMALLFPTIPESFGVNHITLVMNDDLELTAEDTNNTVRDGTYDWIEIVGSTTAAFCPLPGGVCEPNELIPVDGEEWTLGLISDTDWFSDGSLIPDDIPSTFSTLVVGVEIDPLGEEIGLVFAMVEVSVGISPVFETDGVTLTWPAVAGAPLYNVYRGDFGAWIDADEDGLPDQGYGECALFLDPDSSDTVFVDFNEPAPGFGFQYLVATIDLEGTEQFLGSTSVGVARSIDLPCP